MPEPMYERMNYPAAPKPACQTSVRSACPYTKLLTIAVSPGFSGSGRRPRVHTGHMKDSRPRRSPGPSSPPATPVALPPPMTSALAAFERHLRSERSLSAHTVRAYLGDIRSLLEHAARQGAGAPQDLTLAGLRS